MYRGYIKLYRKLKEWEWYDDANTLRLFIHCLLEANHEDTFWHGIQIKSGQFLTGRKKLASALRLTEQQIRTSLKKLTNEITIETTNQYSIISIQNWNMYQSKEPASDKTNNQQIATNKNYKELKEIFIRPSKEEIEQYCIERKNNINAQSFLDYYESKGWMIGKNKMKNWKAAIRTWENRNKKEQKTEEISRYKLAEG